MAINRQTHIDHHLGAEFEAYTPLPYQISQCLDSPFKIQEDATKAKELFDETLYKLGIKIDDFPVVHISTSMFHIQSAKILKNRWEKVLDVNCRIEFNEWTEHIKKMKHGNYQLAMAYWASCFDDPFYTLQAFENEKLFTGWLNHDFQSYLNQSVHTEDLAEKSKLLMKAEELLLKQAVVTPIFYLSDLTIDHHDLRTNVFPPCGSIDFPKVHSNQHSFSNRNNS